MSFYDLNDSQLDYLRWEFFYNPENEGLIHDYETFLDVTYEALEEYYGGVLFVEGDFT